VGKVEREIQELEKTRRGVQGLSQQVRSLAKRKPSCTARTANLVSALRAPQGRGRWARSNSSEWLKWPACLNTATSSSRNRRPRKRAAAPRPGGPPSQRQTRGGGCQDAADGLSGCAGGADEATRTAKLQDTRARCARTSRRWPPSLTGPVQPAPEFVVLFLPARCSSARRWSRTRPDRIRREERVILATPTTLIALLRAVAYGWKQESLAKNAQAISELGKDSTTGWRRWPATSTICARDWSARSSPTTRRWALEARVLVSARKFRELKAGSDEEIEPLQAIDRAPRALAMRLQPRPGGLEE